MGVAVFENTWNVQNISFEDYAYQLLAKIGNFVFSILMKPYMVHIYPHILFPTLTSNDTDLKYPKKYKTYKTNFLTKTNFFLKN